MELHKEHRNDNCYANATTETCYAVIGGTLVIVAETLCDAVDLRAGQHMLDVATGSGNAAIAARSWCDVTGIDYVQRAE